MLDLFSQMKSADLLLRFLRGDMRRLTPYPFSPQKKTCAPLSGTGGLARSTPERAGVPSEHVRRFFEELDRCESIRVHSVMLLRHGKVIAEGSFRPYSGRYPHMMFSLSKSVTGMAVGMAVRENLLSLDEKIVDIFSDKGVLLRSPRINAVTVRHLLNMSSGVKLNEISSMVEKDWVRAFLMSDCMFEPGSEFSYNSMNSYLLSAVVCKKTGTSLTAYLTPRLFQPLGIRGAQWETCPLGIEKGGWGLYLHLADMAKLGQLYLQGGRWTVDGEARQLIPESWIRESTRPQIATGQDGSSGGYGYQIWNFAAKDAYQFNGVFGQYVIVLPERDMVIAMTGGSQNLFSDDSTEIVERYFGDGAPPFSARPLRDSGRALRALRETLGRLYAEPETAPKPDPEQNPGRRWLRRLLFPTPPETVSALAAPLSGRKYRMEPGFGRLLPLLLQGVTNNICDPVTEVSFSFAPGECTVELSDGTNRSMICAGMDGEPRTGTVRLNGDVYAVGATARLAPDEDGRPVLKLFLSFLETPSMRVMKCIFYNDGEERLLIRFSEHPSMKAATQMLMRQLGGTGNGMERALVDLIARQRLARRIDRVVLPRARGTLIPADPEQKSGGAGGKTAQP